MSACLTVESELAHLSTIQKALTQLTASGVPLQISGLKLSKQKLNVAATNRLSKPHTSAKHYPSASLPSTKSIANDSDSKTPLSLLPTSLKRKTCHPDDDEEATSDDESDLDPDQDSDDDEFELLEDAEELLPLGSNVPSDAAPSAMDADGI